MIKKIQQLCLGIDTASDTTSVALLSGDGAHADAQLVASRGQGESLMQLIQDVLQKMNKKPTDLTMIAVTVGPGSFTGVRIGLATARGLGLALNVPVMGVDNFKATAFSLSTSVKVVLDSKRDDFFVQDFDSKLVPLNEPSFQSVDALKKKLPFVACGSGAQRLAEEIGCSVITSPKSMALSVAQIALKHPQRTQEPHPLYLREADVTI